MNLQQRIDFLKSCTKRERNDYYHSVAVMGCIACGRAHTPTGTERTSLHHPNGHGFPAKRDHTPVIPLCLTSCHQYGKESLHRAKTTFQQKYGTQAELLEKVEIKLNEI